MSLISFTALAVLGVASPVLGAVSSRAAVAGEEAHGKLTWFPGTFEEAIAQAKAKNQIVFVDFWTSWCGWCKRLDKDTFSNDTVVAEMKDILCLSVDAESKTGAPLAARFGIRGYPALLVLESDGTKRGQIGGYLAPEDFKREIRRVRALGSLEDLRRQVAQKETDIDLRWKLAQRLSELGDQAGAKRENEAIEKLDPEKKSLPMRWVAFEKVIAAIDAGWQRDQSLDPKPLADFLAEESHPEVRFEGWQRMFKINEWLAGKADGEGRKDAAKALRAESRQALHGAWTNSPQDKRVQFAAAIAQISWKQREELSAEEKTATLEVARRAHAYAEQDPLALDALACALHLNGKKDEAIEKVQRSIELDPKNAESRRHLDEFRANG